MMCRNLLLAGILATGVAGCATVAVDSGSGFDEVRGLVHGRIGREIARAPEDGEASTARDRVLSLLGDGLTAESAVEIALLRNRELQAAFADLGVARSDLIQASLLHNPILDAAAGFPLTGGPADLSFGLAMDVIDLIYVPLRKRVAAAELEETRLHVAVVVLDLAWRTEVAFIQHQADEQMLELRRQVVSSTTASLELARRMREAGNIPELAAASEQALAEEARLDLRLAEIAARESREELNALLGLWGEDTAWRLAAQRLDPPPDPEIDLDRFERRAIEQSLDVAMAERRVVAAGEQLGLTRASALFPEVLIGGEGEREGSWDAGPTLALPLPIFDRGQARTMRARAELRRARDLHRALAVEVRSRARAARDRLLGHRDRALHYRAVQLPLRERITRETQRHYAAMQVGPIELLRAKEEQIETGVRSLEALRDYWLARSDVRLILAGRIPPVEAALERVPVPEGIRRSPIPTLN